jgi:P27 family predicted phage terminase small subunit
MPPRKSDRLHLTQGTYRRDRHGRRRPPPARNPAAPLTEPPAAPEGLDPEAAAEWPVLAERLVAARVLTELDLPLLRLLVETIGTARHAQRALRESGYSVAGPSGAPKAHPAAAVLAQARQQARQALNDLACSPRARATVPVEPVPTGDPADEFFD